MKKYIVLIGFNLIIASHLIGMQGYTYFKNLEINNDQEAGVEFKFSNEKESLLDLRRNTNQTPKFNAFCKNMIGASVCFSLGAATHFLIQKYVGSDLP